MRNLAVLSIVGAFATGTLAAQPVGPLDQKLNEYLSIWTKDENFTRQKVDELYANTVDFYGKQATPAAIFQVKRSFIARWPHRSYKVVPGSTSFHCDADQNRCDVAAILDWKVAGPRGAAGQRGTSTLSLTLTRVGSVLKVERENGLPLATSGCRRTPSGWNCSPYRARSIPSG